MPKKEERIAELETDIASGKHLLATHDYTKPFERGTGAYKLASTEEKVRAVIRRLEKLLKRARSKKGGGTRRNRPFRLRLSRRFLKW